MVISQQWTVLQTATMSCVAQTAGIPVPAALMLYVSGRVQRAVSVMKAM